MKHSNGLKWRFNVVLKHGFAFECLTTKEVTKVMKWNTLKYKISKLSTVFTVGKKLS